jgi:hypothetical protein
MNWFLGLGLGLVLVSGLTDNGRRDRQVPGVNDDGRSTTGEFPA